MKRERSGSVVECLTRDQRTAGSSLNGVTALCPWARHINTSLVLVQPRKTHPDRNWKIADLDVKIQIKQTNNLVKYHALIVIHRLRQGI